MFLFLQRPFDKVRGHSYSLIYSFLNCANISFAVLSLYFVRYTHTLTFRTLYSWKCYSYISNAITMDIWSFSQHLAQTAFWTYHWGSKHRPGPSVCLNYAVFCKRYWSVGFIYVLRHYGTLYQPLPGFEPTIW